ncbi:hypothetical protein AG1IA_09319 [Rhizoctonia solani AG-1 IA]|uniref:Uncharacterized protein n=1 Tax=Thanatephorus cucumeris (strain AG1-IA) TaxID=983506 RepID=L8WFA5_THACA|nr:hypothetical protein AG1IA_09319 [Rhizoctonia solani AG-1 IA]
MRFSTTPSLRSGRSQSWVARPTPQAACGRPRASHFVPHTEPTSYIVYIATEA